MSATLAHVGGVPLEESVLALAPAASVLAMLVRAQLRELGGWRRRR